MGGVTDRAWVGVGEAIRALRAELDAAAGAPGGTVRFEIGPIEMEFALTLTRAADGQAGVRFGVVTVGASGSLSSESVHRVKFVLTPKDKETGAALEIASQLDEIPER
jgi:hypothetical protein